MSSKIKPYVVGVLALGILTQSLVVRTSQGAAPTWAFDIIGEYVLRNTEVGASIVARVTSMAIDEVSDSTYRSFAERMRWSRNKSLHDELNANFARMEKDFEQYRISQNRPAKLDPAQELSQDERDFLKKAGDSLRTNSIEDLVHESVLFVNAYTGPKPLELGNSYETAAHDFASDGKAPATQGEVPPRINPADGLFGERGTVDIRKLQLNWWEDMMVRVRTFARIPHAFALSDGEWISLFTASGRRFTAADRAMLSKIYRSADYLSDYSRMRLTVRAFVNEPADVYTHVNELSLDATKKFMDGLLSIDGYVASRKAVSSSLPLNDIVWETEKRILNVLSRCRALGGQLNGSKVIGGEIAPIERKAGELMEHIDFLEKSIQAGGITGSPREVLRMRAELELSQERLSDFTEILENKYAEFVENRIEIEIFTNLRTGRLTGEKVAAFDMADPFVAKQAELNGWADLLNRAMYNSSHKLVIKESKEFFASQVGATRKFIRDMNKLTEKVGGKRFTDTEYGKEFQEYTRHIAVEGVIRVGQALGVVIPAAVAEQYGASWTKKLWAAMFEDDSPTTAPATGGVRPAVTGTLGGTVTPSPSPTPTPTPAASGTPGEHVPGRGGYLPPLTNPAGN